MRSPATVLLGLTLLTLNARAEPFTIVALPDTQHYVDDPAHLPYLRAQADWIRNHVERDAEPSVVFVTHLGDVVQRAFRSVQYERAAGALAPLENLVPWSVLPGNHDYEVTARKFTGTSSYRERFGPARFAGRPWFGGSDPSGNNTFQIFEASGRRFLHLALEWRPDHNITAGFPRSPSPLEWAQGVLAQHPELPVILSTHEYLDDFPIGRSASGENVWNRLIRRHDRIFLVLNGHYHSKAAGENSGEYMQISRNDEHRPVVEMLQDYQDYPNGGNGWLRLITLDEAAGEIRVRTFSPALGEHQLETFSQVGPYASRFTIPLDLSRRWSPPDPAVEPGPTSETVLHTGAMVEIRSAGTSGTGPDAARLDAWDAGVEPPAQSQVLVKFDGVASAAPSPEATLAEARLVLHTVDPGDGGGVHRMLAAWDRNVTWTQFARNGVQADGVEAAIVPDDAIAEADETVILDVTPAAQHWRRDPSSNHGLAILPRGTNGWDVATFSADQARRPRLVLVWNVAQESTGR